MGVKVWDAQSGHHVANLPLLGSYVRFSPDSKWVLTSGGGARLWRTGTWKEGPALGSSSFRSFGTFSSDSELLALEDVPGVVRLVRTATGKEVARLTAPEQTRLVPQCFTSDGAQLITAGSESEALHIFDLRAIRKQLQALDLDWEAPPLPPAQKDPPPVQVTVDLGRFAPAVQALLAQIDSLRAKGDLVAALALIRKAQGLAPGDAELANDLAWWLVVCPDPKLRDPTQAVALARKAVILAPNDGRYHNTLGVALYRAGDWNAGIGALERSMELSKGGDASDYLFLAMAKWRLNQKTEARKAYDRGVAWMETNKPALEKTPQQAEELRRFRSEAEEVLELRRSKRESPKHKAAGEVSPPSRSLTDPAKPRRSVCAPTAMAFHCNADRVSKGEESCSLLGYTKGHPCGTPLEGSASPTRRRGARPTVQNWRGWKTGGFPAP